MSETFHLHIGRQPIQSSENRISLPAQVVDLGIAKRGLPLYWLLERRTEEVAVSRQAATDGGSRVDERAVGGDFERVGHRAVGDDRVVTVPKEFFPDFEGAATGSQPVSADYQFSRGEPCHFLTSPGLFEERACYVIQDEATLLELASDGADAMLTDGGRPPDDGPSAFRESGLADDRALILETGQVVSLDTAEALLAETTPVGEIERYVLGLADDDPDIDRLLDSAGGEERETLCGFAVAQLERSEPPVQARSVSLLSALERRRPTETRQLLLSRYDTGWSFESLVAVAADSDHASETRVRALDLLAGVADADPGALSTVCVEVAELLGSDDGDVVGRAMDVLFDVVTVHPEAVTPELLERLEENAVEVHREAVVEHLEKQSLENGVDASERTWRGSD